MLWLLSLLAFAGPDAPADQDPFSTDARVVQLDNGLMVVIERRDRTDQLASHLHVSVGSGDERPGEYGCAHLFEHLMFEGSGAAPGNSYDAWLTEAGGTNNAFTSEDETAYHAVAPGGALDRVLFLESDRVRDLSGGLTAESLKNQIDVVLRERDQGYSGPHGRDADALHRTLFPEGHPYHVPVIGTVADVRGFTLDAVRGFHARHYRPDNIVFGLVGNIDVAEAEARARHWFSDVPTVAAPDPPTRPVCRDTIPISCDLPAREEDVDIWLEDNVSDTTVTLAWRGARMGTKEEAALLLASLVLDGGRGTPVDDLLYRGPKVTDASVASWSGEVDGMFLVSGSVEKDRVEGIRRRLFGLLRDLARKPPTDAELTRAKKAVRGYYLDVLEHPASRVEALVDCVRLYGDADCTRAEWERVESVTAEDISRAVSDLLRSPVVTLRVVPVGRGDARLPGLVVELP